MTWRIGMRMEGKQEGMSLKCWFEAEFAERGCGRNNLELQIEHICPGTPETQLTQTSHSPFSRWEQHFPELKSCKILRDPLPAGKPRGMSWDLLGQSCPRTHWAFQSATSAMTLLSIQQPLNISSSTMNCGFSGLICVTAAAWALEKGKINVLFMLKLRRGASGVPGRLGKGIILNKLLMAFKSLAYWLQVVLLD